MEQKQNGKTTVYDKDNTYGELLTTGASSVTEQYHIFDIAGNVWEWTEENSKYNGDTGVQYRMARGGCYLNAYANSPACYRVGHSKVNDTNLSVGFRIVLYIK